MINISLSEFVENLKKIKNKYDGKCAYCGKKLLDDWILDYPNNKVFMEIISKKEINMNDLDFILSNMDKLVPTFSIIGKYKHNLDTEAFRKRLKNLSRRLKLIKSGYFNVRQETKLMLFEVANLFDITENNIFNGEFYFEKIEKKA